MENVKKVINLRGSLRALEVGQTLTLEGVRGSYLRQCASTLRELGAQYRVNKTECGYAVTRLV